MVNFKKSLQKEENPMKDPKNKKPLLKKQILLILGPTGAAVLVLLVILLARSFAGKGDATTVSNDQPDTLEAERRPVPSLRLSASPNRCPSR